MPVYTLTAQLRDHGGKVVDVQQAPFLVLEPGEDNDDAVEDLLEKARELQEEAEELREAARDREHRHHHWWH